MTNEQKLKDLNRENQLRLRAEVNILAERMRRHLLEAYKEEWARSLTTGSPIQIGASRDVVNAIALNAAQRAFGGDDVRRLGGS